MAKVKVEILVSAVGSDNPDATQRYDILAILPAGHNWGRGDLTGRFMFCAELDLPCGSAEEWERRLWCSKCEHFGIEWEDEELVDGSKGSPKMTCPVQKYMSANVSHIFHKNAKGETHTADDLHHKNGGTFDYSNLSFLSVATKNKVEAENPIEPVDIAEAEKRKTTARKAQNAVSSSTFNLIVSRKE